MMLSFGPLPASSFILKFLRGGALCKYYVQFRNGWFLCLQSLPSATATGRNFGQRSLTTASPPLSITLSSAAFGLHVTRKRDFLPRLQTGQFRSSEVPVVSGKLSVRPTAPLRLTDHSGAAQGFSKLFGPIWRLLGHSPSSSHRKFP